MSEIYFYKGNQNILNSEENKNQSIESIKKIQEAFLKVLDNKNLSFLLGSGCSSYKIEGQEIGIPTMAPMAQEFYGLSNFEKNKEWLLSKLKIDVEDKNFEKNLEAFLSVLHSLSFYHSKINNKADEEAQKINQVIKEARNFILEKCLNEENIKNKRDNELLEVYKTFYKKLLTRNSTLPRLNIFTTNYDLYSERAMDSLGIHYANGFTGGISKYFNPTIFNYALAEKMDLSQSKWNVIDNFFYLYKIHGSVNWVENDDEGKLFKIQEIQDPTFDILENKPTVMIHPTPLKYNASLGSPYSDLFREFQKKLMQNNNILVTIGYSFSDEHINNLIFQAFTIPSFRLIIIGSEKQSETIEKLYNLDDSRIWIIGGKNKENESLHYFKGFVNEILPDLTNEDLDKKLESTINNLKDLLR
ncbi:SIR2 family protein [Capnocytophaga sputigena]|uniref:SIR2 family protein n=1 Tax=Capnocytophaga sputigena TaxID=1019 RepID=UPI0031F47C6F